MQKEYAVKTSQNFMFSRGGYRSFLIAAVLCGASAAAADTDSDYYIGVEYLESDGTQYIDTGIVADDDYGYEIDFLATKALSNQNFCGSRATSGDSRFLVGANQSSGVPVVYVGWNGLAIKSSDALDCSTRRTAGVNSLDSGAATYSTANVSLSGTLVKQTGNFYLFAGNYPYESGSASIVYGYCKIYAFRMSFGSETVSEMVPVLRASDETPGMYDTLRGRFFANAGSGTFKYGSETGVVYGDGEVSGAFVASSIPSQTVSSFAELSAGVEPSVTVSNLTTETELVLGTDYTVSYSGNTAIGIAYAVITGMGDYDGKTVLVPFAITGFTAYYAIPSTSGNDAGDHSTVSGTSSAIGWASSRGGTVVATRGITAQNSLYYIWTNRWMRTPPNVNFATPPTTAIIVEPSCVWTLADKMMNKTLTLSNVLVRAGGSLILDPIAENGTTLYSNTIGGTFDLEDGASIVLSAETTAADNVSKQYILSGAVTGKGTVWMPSMNTGATYSTPLANQITGDLSGFTGDIGTWNGVAAVSLELVNANSIPGDPDPPDVAYVVVTNGATLKIDQDWTSPANRVWDFGDGARPTVFVAEGKTVEIKGPLKGASGFVKTGAGTLVLRNASPSFSGMCFVLSGKVCLEGGARKLAPLFRRKETLSLPTGYTLLDHLSLTGGGVDSYIDTGYTPTTATFGFVFDWSPNENAGSSGHRVMGSAYRDGNIWNGVMVGNYSSKTGSSSGQFGFGTTLASVPASSAGGYLPYERMRLMLANGFAELDRGWSQSFGTATTPAYYGSIYIGTIHTQTVTAGSPQDVYRFQVLEGDTLLHDFVPVLRASDGAIGLYDTFGDLGFRGAADAQYISAGPAYSGSDSEWLEVAEPTGLQIMVR